MATRTWYCWCSIALNRGTLMNRIWHTIFLTSKLHSADSPRNFQLLFACERYIIQKRETVVIETFGELEKPLFRTQIGTSLIRNLFETLLHFYQFHNVSESFRSPNSIELADTIENRNGILQSSENEKRMNQWSLDTFNPQSMWNDFTLRQHDCKKTIFLRNED